MITGQLFGGSPVALAHVGIRLIITLVTAIVEAQRSDRARALAAPPRDSQREWDADAIADKLKKAG